MNLTGYEDRVEKQKWNDMKETRDISRCLSFISIWSHCRLGETIGITRRCLWIIYTQTSQMRRGCGYSAGDVLTKAYRNTTDCHGCCRDRNWTSRKCLVSLLHVFTCLPPCYHYSLFMTYDFLVFPRKHCSSHSFHEIHERIEIRHYKRDIFEGWGARDV